MEGILEVWKEISKPGIKDKKENDIQMDVLFLLALRARFEPLNAIVRWTIARRVGPRRLLKNLSERKIL